MSRHDILSYRQSAWHLSPLEFRLHVAVLLKNESLQLNVLDMLKEADLNLESMQDSRRSGISFILFILENACLRC
jgi:hypothetical protein